MIDIVLHNATRTALGLWALNLKLVVDTPAGDYTEALGIRWFWWGGGRLRQENPVGTFAWGGAGKFPVTLGTYDQSGNEITPPTYAPGVVAIVGISHRFFTETTDAEGVVTQTFDQLTPSDTDPDKDEQWARSRIASHINDNGTKGSVTIGGTRIPHREVDGTKLRRYADLQVFLDANGLPGHGWQGGSKH